MADLVIPAVVVHGGAGSLDLEDPAAADGAGAPRLDGVTRAAEAAWRILSAGGRPSTRSRRRCGSWRTTRPSTPAPAPA